MTHAPETDVAVEEIEHLWIPMPDGVRLAARLWRPSGGGRHPAILEIIPYRKRDMVRARDERNHPVFAAHGYACLRIDMRGSGDSEGLMTDMYGEDELADTRLAIEWIARQPWCDGNVGMFGTSWGGTASLQASLDAPGPLKAVIAVCATHDRYEDDIHHKGGCLITDTIEWGATLPAILAAPPDAATVGPRWREMWRARLEGLAFPLETWIREEARGSYWRRGSVTHRTEAISVPVFCVGGWSDRYSNSVMSLVEARPDRVWGLVGPWGHHYPDIGHPGPAIGFQELALEWWDHWLKRGGTGDLRWPRLRLWLREFDPPADAIEERAGMWIELGSCAATTRQTTLTLGSDAFAPRCAPTAPHRIPDDLRIGMAGGDTGYFGRFGGLPGDQAEDDARSLAFDTRALDEDLILIGAPVVRLTIDAPEPRAQIALRLCDVGPDGVSCRIGLALRNLTLDANLDAPRRPVTRRRQTHIGFPTLAYRLRAGRRLRLSLSASYWPTAWPSPGAQEIRLISGELSLPVASAPVRALASALPSPWMCPSAPRHSVIAAPRLERLRTLGPLGQLVSEWRQPLATLRHHETGSVFGFESRARHCINPDDPLSAESRFEHRLLFERADGVAETRSAVAVVCDAERFFISGQAEATWNGDTIFKRQWEPTLTRRLA